MLQSIILHIFAINNAQISIIDHQVVNGGTSYSVFPCIALKPDCQQRISPPSPQYEPEYNSSTTPALIDIEKALNHPAMLKLSQIASKLKYYNVGDARYTVTQAIAIPDSDAFITFNNPRIYYRKQGIPSKRYGFKALDYKWNHGMNSLNLFFFLENNPYVLRLEQPRPRQ